MQRYTVYFIWKLLYMFRVVPSPIIRSANNCIYNIWYLSDRYCYLPLQQQQQQQQQQQRNPQTLRILRITCSEILPQPKRIHRTYGIMSKAICLLAYPPLFTY
jgi:hypothetical protein